MILQKVHQSFFSIATFIDSKDSWGLFAAVQEFAQKDGKVKTRNISCINNIITSSLKKLTNNDPIKNRIHFLGVFYHHAIGILAFKWNIRAL